jgi:hypothetical protein
MSTAAYRLIVRSGPNPGMTVDLTKEVTMFGRDVTNEVVLGDAEVSRQHSRLTRTPAGFVLEDLGSTNGTFVNNERLAAPRVLKAGDLIGLGENVTLTFDSTSPEAAATVLGAAAPRTVGPTATAAPARGAAPVAPATPGEPAKPGGSRRWLLAGCGCLVLLVLCGILFWFMDAYYPNVLYAPLKMLGF